MKRAFEVRATFTVNAESEDDARRVLEGLLSDSLDPESITYQKEPHEILDSWVVEGSYCLDVRCETRGCKNRGKVINRITGIASVGERDQMLEEWRDASSEADVCPLCGELGHAEEVL